MRTPLSPGDHHPRGDFSSVLPQVVHSNNPLKFVQGILLLTIHSSVSPHLLFPQCREIPVSKTHKSQALESDH